MIRSAHLAALTAILLSACASGGSTNGTRSPDRVLVTTAQGDVVRQQTDAIPTAKFAKSPDVVWAAVVGSYVDMGIAANSSDRSQWRYGAVNYIMPRRFRGLGIASLFSCGSGMTGPLAEQGRIRAEITTTLVPQPDGSTSATFYVDGLLQKSEGSSSDPMHCSSTGQIEELLRKSIELKLASS
jgi:hypothetical protein